MDVEIRAFAPDGYDHQHSGGTKGIHQRVQHRLDTAAFKCDVRALAIRYLPYLFRHVHLGRVQGVVRDAGLQGLLAAQRAELGDGNGDALGFENSSGQQANRPRAADQCHVSGFCTGPLHGVIPD